jgi:ABC-type molybdate transport system substrate-binding protein
VIAFAVPPEDGPSIVYPAAVAVDAPNPAGAAQLLDYLGSPEARRRFDEAGFISLPPAPWIGRGGDEVSPATQSQDR